MRWSAYGPTKSSVVTPCYMALRVDNQPHTRHSRANMALTVKEVLDLYDQMMSMSKKRLLGRALAEQVFP